MTQLFAWIQRTIKRDNFNDDDDDENGDVRISIVCVCVLAGETECRIYIQFTVEPSETTKCVRFEMLMFYHIVEELVCIRQCHSAYTQPHTHTQHLCILYGKLCLIQIIIKFPSLQAVDSNIVAGEKVCGRERGGRQNMMKNENQKSTTEIKYIINLGRRHKCGGIASHRWIFAMNAKRSCTITNIVSHFIAVF